MLLWLKTLTYMCVYRSIYRWFCPPPTLTLVHQNPLVKCCVHVLAMYAMSMNHSQTYMVGFGPPPSPFPLTLIPQNPLGDAVGEHCQEVIGRHNTSLEVLNIHSARMSTPAVSSVCYLPLSVHGGHTPVDPYDSWTWYMQSYYVFVVFSDSLMRS